MALALAQCSGSCISWHRSMIRFIEVVEIWVQLVLLHLMTALIPQLLLILPSHLLQTLIEDGLQVLVACTLKKAHMLLSDPL